MIPDLVDIGASWKVLPPGIHSATLPEVRNVFATSPARKRLFAGLVNGAKALHQAGCALLYLDGSYVTRKFKPIDYDIIWDHNGVDPAKLDPVFLDFSAGRQQQKLKYLGEFLPTTFLPFFQIDKETGKLKGIIVVFLNTDPLIGGGR